MHCVFGWWFLVDLILWDYRQTTRIIHASSFGFIVFILIFGFAVEEIAVSSSRISWAKCQNPQHCGKCTNQFVMSDECVKPLLLGCWFWWPARGGTICLVYEVWITSNQMKGLKISVAPFSWRDAYMQGHQNTEGPQHVRLVGSFVHFPSTFLEIGFF